MNWDNYIALINTLDLKCCDLRYLCNIKFDKYKVIQIDNDVLGKLDYFTDDFYKNLIKTSQYMVQNFVNMGWEISDIEIIINKQKVTYRYKFSDTPIKRCIKLQEEYENKKILSMKTAVMFKPSFQIVTDKMELYLDISYIDNGLVDAINYILDNVLDFDMIAKVVHEIEERIEQNRDKFNKYKKESKVEVNKALERFKNIEEFIKNTNNRESIAYFRCKHNYTKVTYKSNTDQIDITYKDGKDIILEQNSDDESKIQLSRHEINGLEKIGLGFKIGDKGAWRLI